MKKPIRDPSREASGSPAFAPPPPALLELCGVTKHFDRPGGRITVLAGVDLTARRGDIIVITGRSGSGKSTLLGLMAGLDAPSSGSVVLDGRPLESLPAAERALLRGDLIGLIFQSANLLAAWTAVENIESALLPTRLPRARRREQALGILSRMGLEPRAHHLPGELSAGEAQRVAVARTLAREPALILADEPTGDVDPETAREILDLLVEPVKARGAALIIATHAAEAPLEAVGARPTRALRLKDGLLKPEPDPDGG